MNNKPTNNQWTTTRKYLFKGSVRRWTVSSIECFKRGCICEGCYYQTFFTDKNQKCHMKAAVLESVRVLGKPESVKEKSVIQEEQ